MWLCSVTHLSSIWNRLPYGLHTDVAGNFRTVFHKSVISMKLLYLRRGPLATHSILLYTVYSQTISDHAHVRPIILTHAHITANQHAPEGGAWHYILFWMLDRDQYEVFWRSTMKISYYSRIMRPPLRNALGFSTSAEGSIWIGLHSSMDSFQTSPGRRRLKRRGVM